MNKKPLRKIHPVKSAKGGAAKPQFNRVKNIRTAKTTKSVCRFWDLAARLEHRRIKKVSKNKKGRR